MCIRDRFCPKFRCHGNEIWDKIGYNSACVRDFCEIFAPIKGISSMGHRMLPIAISPVCHKKIGSCMRFKFSGQLSGFMLTKFVTVSCVEQTDDHVDQNSAAKTLRNFVHLFDVKLEYFFHVHRNAD